MSLCLHRRLVYAGRSVCFILAVNSVALTSHADVWSSFSKSLSKADPTANKDSWVRQGIDKTKNEAAKLDPTGHKDSVVRKQLDRLNGDLDQLKKRAAAIDPTTHPNAPIGKEIAVLNAELDGLKKRAAAIDPTHRDTALGKRIAELNVEIDKLKKAAAAVDRKRVAWSNEELAKASHAMEKLWASMSKYARDRLLSLFMESPRFIQVDVDPQGNRVMGDPVFYVNGMLTPRAEVIEEAKALAGVVRRPVYVILNPSIVDHVPTGTRTCADDVSEAVYDKLWPENFATGNWINEVELLVPGTALPSPPWAQLNPTTRQLTHLIYHARRPISIVSHSQGCLQTRNALLAVGLLAEVGTVSHQVAWVATGTPVHEAEIWPWPAKYHRLVNSNDPVAVWIGTRGGPGAFREETFTQASEHHEPIANYIPRVTADMLFPSESPTGPVPLGLAGKPPAHPSGPNGSNPPFRPGVLPSNYVQQRQQEIYREIRHLIHP